MRKISILLAMTAVVISFTACNNTKKMENPFFTAYTTEFQVPPFNTIDTSDYMPAFIEGMKQQMAEIDSIVNNPEAPTFENTILVFDKSGKLLTNVSKVFFNVNEANTNDAMQKIARDVTPLLSKHGDDIAMNPKLFERIKVVYDNRNNLNLDPQQIRVVEKYYSDFVRNGANLSKEQQDKMRKINEELSMLNLTFGENLLAETNESFFLVVDDKKDIENVPQGVVDVAAETAKEKKMDGKWVFTLSKSSMLPFLQYSPNREMREKIYTAYLMKGNNNNKNDNKEIVSKIAKLRVEKAQILGYPDYASYVIEENMAKTPANVDKFLSELWTPAMKVSKSEVAEMQKIIDKEGGNFKLAPWDWWYYSDKVRKEKYDLDENELKPYFSLDNVRDGMFMVANKLYGITFTKLDSVPVYQEDVEVFDVKEADGKHLGVLYLDYYARPSKRGGAWCTDFQSAGWENGKKVDPIISMVCNATPPSGDTPSLLTFEETSTMFHEFGHALHGLFSEGKYDRTAGNVPQDYVELPSQVMENWASDPQVMKMYAKHYKTGEVIPDELITKIVNSGKFNQGFETGEYLAASILDMDYHELRDTTAVDVLVFEKNAMDKIGLIPEILPRYRSTYFAHIFDGGYAAGYYVYIWAAVLDADAFAAFKESGDVFNPELAAKFRKYCLQECGDDEGMIQYVKFRGKEPSVKALLDKRGLN
jgi:peptidyl-dipeptidase Dcp